MSTCQPFADNCCNDIKCSIVVSSLCPAIFKIIANFGSNATSVMEAGERAAAFFLLIGISMQHADLCREENCALQYFWWFMLISAFSGTSFSTAVIQGFNQGLNIGMEIQGVIEATARAIPSEVSATWLNWIIVRFTIVLPTQYLLQMNSFVFACLGMKCCSRVVRGGGKCERLLKSLN